MPQASPLMTTVEDPQDRSDRLLLAEIAGARSRQSMDAFYRRYQTRLVPFLQRLTGDRGLVEEVYNDVMLKVWSKAHQFNGDAKVSSWVFAIGYRDCLRLVRRNRGRDVKLALHAAESLVLDQPDGGDQPFDGEQIRLALAQLPAKQRYVLELFYFQELSIDDIAVVVGRPANTVKTRLHHARRKMHTLLEELR